MLSKIANRNCVLFVVLAQLMLQKLAYENLPNFLGLLRELSFHLHCQSRKNWSIIEFVIVANCLWKIANLVQNSNEDLVFYVLLTNLHDRLSSQLKLASLCHPLHNLFDPISLNHLVTPLLTIRWSSTESASFLLLFFVFLTNIEFHEYPTLL